MTEKNSSVRSGHGPLALVVTAAIILILSLVSSALALLPYSTVTTEGQRRIVLSYNPVAITWTAVLVISLVVAVILLAAGLHGLWRRTPGRRFPDMKPIALVFGIYALLTAGSYGLFVACDGCGKSCLRWQAVHYSADEWASRSSYLALHGLAYDGPPGPRFCPRCLGRMKPADIDAVLRRSSDVQREQTNRSGAEPAHAADPPAADG